MYGGTRGFEITSEGVKVTASIAEYEGIITGSPRRVAPARFMELFRKAAKRGE